MSHVTVERDALWLVLAELDECHAALLERGYEPPRNIANAVESLRGALEVADTAPAGYRPTVGPLAPGVTL